MPYQHDLVSSLSPYCRQIGINEAAVQRTLCDQSSHAKRRADTLKGKLCAIRWRAQYDVWLIVPDRQPSVEIAELSLAASVEGAFDVRQSRVGPGRFGMTKDIKMLHE